MKERRSEVRYPLILPVMVSGIPSAKEIEPQLGWTRNISPQGIYFLFERRLAVGTKLRLSILFPKASIKGQAKVVRAEGRRKAGGKQAAIAARMENPKIVRAK